MVKTKKLIVINDSVYLDSKNIPRLITEGCIVKELNRYFDENGEWVNVELENKDICTVHHCDVVIYVDRNNNNE